jgi:hypothetical protein
MGRELGSGEEDWYRWTNVGCHTCMHGNNTRILPV